MKKFRLPKGAKAAIREWLTMTSEDKPGTCPFAGVRSTECCDVCQKMFPRISRESESCPCHMYTLSYVVKKAKEVIR